MSPWQHTPWQHTDLIGTANFRLLVTSRKEKNQADQSNSPYSVTFSVELAFDWSVWIIFPRWDKQPTIDCSNISWKWDIQHEHTCTHTPLTIHQSLGSLSLCCSSSPLTLCVCNLSATSSHSPKSYYCSSCIASLDIQNTMWNTMS